MILDSTVFVDILRGEKKAIEKIRELEEANTPLSTTAITVFELLQDTRKHTSEEIQKIIDLIDAFHTIPFDLHAAKEGGFMHARLQKEGAVIDAEDCMIAGIVKLNHETLLTRNTKHFTRIKELKIDSY